MTEDDRAYMHYITYWPFEQQTHIQSTEGNNDGITFLFIGVYIRYIYHRVDAEYALKKFPFGQITLFVTVTLRKPPQIFLCFDRIAVEHKPS